MVRRPTVRTTDFTWVDRTSQCLDCGVWDDRNRNAAQNIRYRAWAGQPQMLRARGLDGDDATEMNRDAGVSRGASSSPRGFTSNFGKIDEADTTIVALST